MSGHGRTRLVGLAGTAWGLALIAEGDELWRRIEGGRPSQEARLVVDVLGARHAVQGLAQIVAPRLSRGPAVLVDSLHAASMVALAVRRPRYRRVALVSAAAAASAALVGHSARPEGPAESAA